jgi:ribonuclease Z
MPRSPEPWKARVVSSVSADSDSAFQIAFGDAKYLFNCPENTTRAMLSRKLGFNKYKAVFLSRISSNTSTGLPGRCFCHPLVSHLIVDHKGFLMTLADSGTPNLTVHGPPGLMHFLASARSYLLRFSPPTLPGIHGNSDPIFSDRLELNAFETTVSTSEPIYTDNNVSVYAIPVSAPDSDKPSTTEDAIPEPDSPYSLKRKHPDIHEDAPVAKRTSFDGAGRKGSPQRDTRSDMKKQDPDGWRKLIVRRMFPGKDGVTFHGGGDQSTLRQRLPQWSHRPFATSYLVVGPEFRGKFDGALADRLGVPHGPARRKLTTGENVTLENGQVITPDMVIGKTSLSAVCFSADLWINTEAALVGADCRLS